LFLLDTHFGFLSLEQITSYMPQNSKILGSIVFSDSALIFTKRNIKYIVKRIFYTPMRTHSLGKQFGVVFLARKKVCNGSQLPEKIKKVITIEPQLERNAVRSIFSSSTPAGFLS
jgi:hypothetical protein